MTTTSSTPETVALTALPTPGTWTIDPVHSTAEFSARHMMTAKVKGHFADLSGAVTVAERPEDSSVEVTIQAASIDTRTPDRDTHLRSADFLDVEHYPTLTFRSTSVVPKGGTDYDVAGELTIKDVTRPVVLSMEYNGTAPDPWGGTRAGFSAETEIDREDWGLTWNKALETGGVLVGKKVKIIIEVEAVLEKMATPAE